MRPVFTKDRITRRHGRLVRAVAVFFVLFTVGDIAFPQYFCGEEAGGLPDVVVRNVPMPTTDSTRIRTELATLADQQDSRQEQAPDSAPHEEDCFCCCAHVLPSTVVANIGASELRSQSAPPNLVSLQSPPLRGPYHPPRSA